MNDDQELLQWRAEWAEQPVDAPSAAEVRERTMRQQFKLRVQLVVSVAFALLLFGFSAWVLWRNPQRETALWTAVIYASTTVALGFSFWNWRTLRQADLKAIPEFTAAYRARCISEIRAVRFGRWFLAAQTLISVPWLTIDYLRGSLPLRSYAWSLILLAILGLGFLRWFSRAERKAFKALKEIDDFLRPG